MFSFSLRRGIPHDRELLLARIALQDTVIRMLLRWNPRARQHLTDADRRQLAELAQPLGWQQAAMALVGFVAAPTLRHWYRRFVQSRPKPKRRQIPGGRTPISNRTVSTIVKLARENPWGYKRIVGALAGMGMLISASTVRRVLKANHIKPAPDRMRSSKHWRGFLAAHWPTLASIDFTTIPVLTWTGWKPTMIAVVMHVATRRVHCCAVTQHPDAPVMQQIARNLTMADTGFLARHGITHLIHDGGGEFCKTGFDQVLEGRGITILRTPPRSPNCNAHIERFFRSLKEECLDRISFVGDRGLRNTVEIYCAHFNHRRPHQGIGNRHIDPDPLVAQRGSRMERKSKLGGVLNFYHRSAA